MLKEFIALFPVLEVPLTITEESIIHFSKANKIVSQQFYPAIKAWEQEEYLDEEDDLEFIACCRLELDARYTTLIYWRGQSLRYEYFVVNLDAKGKLLDRRLIAGLVMKDDTTLRMVVSIDINGIFYISSGVEGQDVTTSHAIELADDGTFISS